MYIESSHPIMDLIHCCLLPDDDDDRPAGRDLVRTAGDRARRTTASISLLPGRPQAHANLSVSCCRPTSHWCRTVTNVGQGPASQLNPPRDGASKHRIVRRNGCIRRRRTGRWCRCRSGSSGCRCGPSRTRRPRHGCAIRQFQPAPVLVSEVEADSTWMPARAQRLRSCEEQRLPGLDAACAGVSVSVSAPPMSPSKPSQRGVRRSS